MVGQHHLQPQSDHVLLRNLLPILNRLNQEQHEYVGKGSSIDFVVYNRVTNQPLLAIEVEARPHGMEHFHRVPSPRPYAGGSWIAGPQTGLRRRGGWATRQPSGSFSSFQPRSILRWWPPQSKVISSTSVPPPSAQGRSAW